MEAANFAIRHNKVINRYYQRKLTKVHRVSALKAIACKLSKAAFYVMRDEVKFELKLAFSS